MDIQSKKTLEVDTIGIKKIIAYIHKNESVFKWHNYYDFSKCMKYCAVRGEKAVVFWCNDGSVIRGFFYAIDLGELKNLLSLMPTGCIVDYLFRHRDEALEKVFCEAGLKQIYEMHRMSEAGITLEKRQQIDKKIYKMRRLYRADRVRVADISELEIIYQKLYEVFDAKMGHLPSKDLLMEYIKNGWVIVYYENKLLCGLYIFVVQQGGRHYGYQVWNGAGPVGYFSLREKEKEVYLAYLLEHGYDPAKVPAAYSWVDANNTQAVSVIEWRGGSFDGLYDFVYEKQ